MAVDYRVIFLDANHGPPWTCEFCSRPIVVIGGQEGRALVVHHRDHNRSNHDISNLAPMHKTCHGRHHNVGKRYPPDVRARMTEGQVRRAPHSDETKRRMSEAHRGHETSEETRRKISAANTGKKRTPEARARMSEAAKRRRKTT